MMLFENARLIDPASGRDELGISAHSRRRLWRAAARSPPMDDERVIDLKGAALAPALIDLRCTADPASTGARALTLQRARRRRAAWRRLCCPRRAVTA
jgi:dihydroorotase